MSMCCVVATIAVASVACILVARLAKHLFLRWIDYLMTRTE